MRKQREEEDFWDEHEDPRSESSSDESNFDESSHDEQSSDEESLEVDDGRGDNTQEGLRDNDGGVPLEVEDPIFRPVWKDNAGGYLRGVRRCDSSTTEKRERQRKRGLKKSASTTRSIVDMFSTQLNKNQSSNKGPLPTSLSAAPPPTAFPPAAPQTTASAPKCLKRNVQETRFESQTRAAQDLGELLHLKTVQMDRYGHVLVHKSNLHLRHQMVQSFLLMQLNKKKDNPGLNRRSLAQIVAHSFNRRAYTGRKIIQLERSWVKTQKIPYTKAGKHLHVVSWMEDEDLILSLKEWSRKTGESKNNYFIMSANLLC